MSREFHGGLIGRRGSTDNVIAVECPVLVFVLFINIFVYSMFYVGRGEIFGSEELYS